MPRSSNPSIRIQQTFANQEEMEPTGRKKVKKKGCTKTLEELLSGVESLLESNCFTPGLAREVKSDLIRNSEFRALSLHLLNKDKNETGCVGTCSSRRTAPTWEQSQYPAS